MQQSLRPFECTDPNYTTEDFLNAITANMVITVGPEQKDSPYHEAWILKRIAMIQTALIGRAQQWDSHLLLEMKKNGQAFCREFQKTFNNQQLQTQAKLLLESITRASCEKIKTLALGIEQMTWKAYANSAQDICNAQLSDLFVKALDPQLDRIAPKKIANHKSTALEPELPFAQLVQKINQEDITKTHIDRKEINTNSTFSSSITNLSLDIDHLTVDEIHMTEQDFAQGIKAVRHKYSNDPNFKGQPLFLKFYKRRSRSENSFSTCPDRRYTTSLEKPNYQNKLLVKQWKVTKTFQTNKSHQTIWTTIKRFVTTTINYEQYELPVNHYHFLLL